MIENSEKKSTDQAPILDVNADGTRRSPLNLSFEVIQVVEAVVPEDSETTETADSLMFEELSDKHPPFSMCEFFTPDKPTGESYRRHAGTLIGDYDSNNRRPFTDPLTNEAIRNLNVSLDELFYPTNRDLYRYTRDVDMREIVREQLIERVKRTQEAVREEYDRLAQMPSIQGSTSRTIVSGIR